MTVLTNPSRGGATPFNMFEYLRTRIRRPPIVLCPCLNRIMNTSRDGAGVPVVHPPSPSLSPPPSLFPHLSGVGRCTRSNFSGALSGSRSSRQKSPLTTQRRERETVTSPVYQYPTRVHVPCYPLHVLRLSLGLSQSSRRHQSGGSARDRGDRDVPPSVVRPVTARPTAHCTVVGRLSVHHSPLGEMDCVTPPVPVWASWLGRWHLVPRGAALCFMDAVWCRINTVRRCGTLWDAAGHCGTVTRFTDSAVVVFGAVSRAVAPADLARSPATER